MTGDKMNEFIRQRISAVQQGHVPVGYRMEKAMLYPDDWGNPVPLNTVLRENKARNESLAFGKEDVLSVSGEQGVVNQIQLLGRSYAGESVAPYHIVETGDLVYTKSPLKENPYGIIKQNRGKPGIVSTLYAVYHCDNPITGQYLENYFSVDTFLNNYLKPIVKRGAKNDMKVNNEDVLLGRVPLPSVEEQRRINEVLSKTDYLIHQKLEIIENLRRLKTICLIKMFPRKGATVPELRFPGFTAPWEQRKLGDVCQVTMGQSPDGSTYSDTPSDYILVQGNADLKDGWVSPRIWTTQKTKTAEAGDLIMSVRAPAGSMGKTSYDVVLGRGVAGIQGNEFIYQSLVKMDSDGYWKKLAAGSTFESINSDVVNGAELMAPQDIDEQNKIGDYFASIDALITLRQRELEEEQRKKKALMQLLLTGLVRVNA